MSAAGPTSTRPLVATWRAQLTPSFGFAAVAAIVPDLARLGISHLYCSPVAEAVTGSTHGYDVVEPSAVRAELGGRDELLGLARTAEAAGIGLVVDIVPNHVSTAEPARNPWWWSVLRDGRGADHAGWFDVDWEHGGGKVIVPVLGAPLPDVLDAGELVVEEDRLRYHDRTFPLRSDAANESGADGAGSLAKIVGRQHYRLQHWRAPARNVRRFFTIDDLVAIRPEVPEVAAAVHRIVAELAGLGLLDGVRVDHVDGLADPEAYLWALRAAVGDARWIAVEKILVGAERLPPSWPVAGTTGYEWIRVVDHLFTHPAGERPLTDLWRDVTGDTLDYHEHERAGINAVLRGELRPDVERLARVAARSSGGAVGAGELVDAIVELATELGRYRTYLTTRADACSPAEDVALIRRAGDAAASRLPDAPTGDALAHLVELVLGRTETTVRWQQLTGPALAKGGEDRALYRSLRLAAHNEVGGDPAAWALPIGDFHDHNLTVAAHWPATLLAGSTHDTKRSEDVRARLLALTEIGDRWVAQVESWTTAIADRAPGGAALLLALQTAVGSWPIDADRLGAYLVKAAREAGLDTTWADPDDDHEAALHRLAAHLTARPMAAEIETFVAGIEPAARSISLAQLLLRCTAPGVPDLYQGGQSWLHTLVDPDNRRPVDVAELRLAAAAASDHARAVWTSDRPKAAVLGRALGVRRRNAAAFAPGSGYVPLGATGAHAEHVIAFARTPPDGAGPTVVTVAARYPQSRPDGWLDTEVELPAGAHHDALDPGGPPFGGPTALADLLGERPAALLTVTTH